MHQHTVRDVMTSPVVTVEADTPFKEVVAVLEGKGLSAVPVVDDDGTLIGIIGQTDLLYRQQPDGAFGSWPRRWSDSTPYDTHRAVAGDLMSAPPVTVDGEASLAQAARLMYTRGVHRLPVVDGAGRLVGIVAPRDLLRVFLRPDAEIRRQIVEDVVGTYLQANPALVDVRVRDGQVTISGELPLRSQLPLAERMIAGIDGVVGVESDLTAAVDDHGFPHTADTATY